MSNLRICQKCKRQLMVNSKCLLCGYTNDESLWYQFCEWYREISIKRILKKIDEVDYNKILPSPLTLIFIILISLIPFLFF